MRGEPPTAHCAPCPWSSPAEGGSTAQTHLAVAPCALLHEAPRHGAADGETLEEAPQEVAEAQRDQLLQGQSSGGGAPCLPPAARSTSLVFTPGRGPACQSITWLLSTL